MDKDSVFTFKKMDFESYQNNNSNFSDFPFDFEHNSSRFNKKCDFGCNDNFFNPCFTNIPNRPWRPCHNRPCNPCHNRPSQPCHDGCSPCNNRPCVPCHDICQPCHNRPCNPCHNRPCPPCPSEPCFNKPCFNSPCQPCRPNSPCRPNCGHCFNPQDDCPCQTPTCLDGFCACENWRAFLIGYLFGSWN